MTIIRTIAGQVPGPVRVLSYRKDFFGKHYGAWLQKTMREAKHWSVGEVELMAAYVSSNNECQFCAKSHISVTSNAFERSVVMAAINEEATAPIDEKLKLVLAFLKQLTLAPSELTSEDFLPMLEAGLPKEAIEEAIHVCGTFCVINRFADAFDFAPSVDLEKDGAFLFKNGYGFVSLRG